jgi:mono/diheme cytochrome c family protein
MRNILLAVVAAAGLVGCVGGIDTPSSVPTTPPPDGVGGGTTDPAAAAAARQAFDTNVFPIISAKCAACHSISGPVGNITGFVGADAATAYTTAVGYQALVGDRTPTGSPILTKISGGHQGQTYTDAEKSKITDWLNKELAARTSAPPTGTTPPAETPGEATVRLTKEWSGCMTLANFTTANMVAWGNMRAGNSACKTCHVNGEFGEIASDVPGPFFTLISTNKYYMSQYFSVDLTQGVAAAKVILNTRSFIAVGTGLAPHQEHPRFQLANSTGMVALQKFYDLTVAAKTAGTCGPPTLTN